MNGEPRQSPGVPHGYGGIRADLRHGPVVPEYTIRFEIGFGTSTRLHLGGGHCSLRRSQTLHGRTSTATMRANRLRLWHSSDIVRQVEYWFSQLKSLAHAFPQSPKLRPKSVAAEFPFKKHDRIHGRGGTQAI